ncbi:MAG: hypothetical protein QOG34_1168 [Frankiaceae bacterium]|nr:hypothetical protein [Frankiaceae bacterium]
MTDIEELVRESLRTAPPVVPSTSDPVAAVAGRVRRARALWGGGVVAVVAVVVAAVVVPLSLRDSSAGHLVPAGPSPSASPQPSADVRGVTPWDTDVLGVTSGGGFVWELRRDEASSNQSMLVVKVDPATHGAISTWKVAGGDALAYGGGAVWVWTHSTHEIDMVTGGGLVQAVDVSSGKTGSYAIGTNEFMDELSVLPQPNGRADALAMIGSSVRQLRFEDGAIRVVASMPLSKGAYEGETFGPLVATGAGDYWVADAGRLLQLDLRPAASGELELAAQPKDSVSWSGSLVGGGAGRDDIWTYDGERVIDLSPALLHQGSSVAQGDRVTVPGWVDSVASDGAGGIFVTVGETQVPIKGARPGLYHLTAAELQAGAGVTHTKRSLPGVVPTQLAPDGHGGVDFATADGVAEHWTG